MKLLLVDDHVLFREGMGHVLSEWDAEVSLIEAGCCADALALARDHQDLDVILLDLALPGESGMDCLVTLRELLPTVPVIVLSASDSREIIAKTLRLGASGYLTKSSSGALVLQALRLVFAGGVYAPYDLIGITDETDTSPNSSTKGMTQRQLDVLRHLAQGKSNKEIGIALGMAEPTVRVHVTAILKFLAVGNRTEAALKAMRLGLIAPELQ